MGTDSLTADNVSKLGTIFELLKERRVLVIGTTCVGKSTLASYFPLAIDMDSVVFPKMSDDERREVSARVIWSPETGRRMTEIARRMTEIARRYISIERGHPVFGTVLLDSDYIVHLKASEFLLQQRTGERCVDYFIAKNMADFIESQVRSSRVRYLDFILG